MNDELILTLIAKVDEIQARIAAPAPATIPREWLSIKQVAEVTSLSADHIRRHVVGGTLPCTNVGTPDRPLYRISLKDLETFMNQRRAGALAPPKKKGKTPLPYSPFIRTSKMEKIAAQG